MQNVFKGYTGGNINHILLLTVWENIYGKYFRPMTSVQVRQQGASQSAYIFRNVRALRIYGVLPRYSAIS